MSAVSGLVEEVSVAAACRALHMPRSALYRDRASRRICSLHAGCSARHPPLAQVYQENITTADQVMFDDMARYAREVVPTKAVATRGIN